MKCSLSTRVSPPGAEGPWGPQVQLGGSPGGQGGALLQPWEQGMSQSRQLFLQKSLLTT